MNDSIILRKNSENILGVQMCKCPRCGQSNNELVLTGARRYVITCKCGCDNYGATYRDKCGMCREPLAGCAYRKLDEQEVIPTSLCKSCQDELALHKQVVENGGVYFRCLMCGISGVIRKSPFADSCRLTMTHKTDTDFINAVDGKYPLLGVEMSTCDEHKTE